MFGRQTLAWARQRPIAKTAQAAFPPVSVIPTPWSGRKYFLDKMTLRELVWAYLTYPAIQAYVVLAVDPVAFPEALPRMLALLGSAVSLAAHAHVVNDVYDLRSDQAAGKANGLAGISPAHRVVLRFLLVAGGIAPWLFVPLRAISIVVLAGLAVIPMLYSAPPVRLKERGFLGLATDAILVHMLPTLFIASLFLGAEADRGGA